jgi:hypothetical protein
VAQRNVAARQDLQVQVGHRRGLGLARIDHDPLLRRPRRPRILQATAKDRMRPGEVAACDEDEVGIGEIVVARGWRVGAERGLVARDRARHAQPRVGVDVVGAEQSLGELVEDVVVLGQQLAGDVQADRVGTVSVHRIYDPVRQQACRIVPRDRLGRRTTPRAPHRAHQTRLRGDVRRRRQVQRAALGAQPAEVGRVIGVAAHVDDRRALGADQHAAADAAIRARRARLARPLLRLVRDNAGDGHGALRRWRSRSPCGRAPRRPPRLWPACRARARAG